MLTFISKYPVSCLLVVVVAGLSLMPIPEAPIAKDIPLFDKWTHMVMYASLTSAIWIEYFRQHRHTGLWRYLRLHGRRIALLGIVAPLCLGGVLELLQAYATTYRSGEWLDFAANSIGVAAGTCIGLTFARFNSIFIKGGK